MGLIGCFKSQRLLPSWLQVCLTNHTFNTKDSNKIFWYLFLSSFNKEGSNTGADPGFQVRGGALKKSRRAEGGMKIFGVFRVKNFQF